MTPDPEFEGEERLRPGDVDPEEDKTVFSPELGEWVTIADARQRAEDRAKEQRQDRLVRGEHPEPGDIGPTLPEDDEPTVFSPEHGEWLTIEQTQRRAAARTSDAESDLGFLKSDIGKSVMTVDGEKDGDGKIIHVEDGLAYLFFYSTFGRLGTELVADPRAEYIGEYPLFRVSPDIIKEFGDTYVRLKVDTII